MSMAAWREPWREIAMTRRTSPIWSPTVKLGLSDVIGSEDHGEAVAAQILHAPLRRARSWPYNWTEPVTRAPVPASSRMIASR